MSLPNHQNSYVMYLSPSFVKKSLVGQSVTYLTCLAKNWIVRIPKKQIMNSNWRNYGMI